MDSGRAWSDPGSARYGVFLHRLRSLQIPVYKGCANSLSGLPPSGDGFHGIDSLGDVPHLFPGDVSLLQPQHSSIALLELAKKHKGMEKKCFLQLAH